MSNISGGRVNGEVAGSIPRLLLLLDTNTHGALKQDAKLLTFVLSLLLFTLAWVAGCEWVNVEHLNCKAL